MLIPLFVNGNNADPNATFAPVVTSDGSLINMRHEGGSIKFGGQLYAIGGRSLKPIESYDPDTNKWTDHGLAPFEISHIQPVATGGKIYMLGGFDCCYPQEPTLPEIQIYDPFTGIWSTGATIPAARLRGSAGAVVRNNKIYLIGGNTLGHDGGAVAWFDEYDPATDSWTQLPDAPNARDHFFAALLDDKLVAASGRQTTQPDFFDNTVAETDVYDFDTGQWLSGMPDIPTPRAGANVVTFGDEVIYLGGESAAIVDSHVEVDAFNVTTFTWRSLQALVIGTHTGIAGILDGEVHIVSGSSVRGGGGENDIHMKALYDNPTAVNLDSDGDGLTDNDEVSVHLTDPNKADSDDDGLDDKEEIELESDPLDADTDNDTLQDGIEVSLHLTNPLKKDTDGDTIDDNDELDQGLNPRKTDSDDDGLQDDFEQATSNTDPLNDDSDSDGLTDGEEVNQHNSDPNDADSDQDGLSDFDEIAAGSNVNASDTDADGLTDSQEVQIYYTNPASVDTDQDTIDDYSEVNVSFTSPIEIDTDGDGLGDGDEINNYGTNPNSEDSDNDGLADNLELDAGFNPNLVDTDGNGITDFDEFNGNGTTTGSGTATGDGTTTSATTGGGATTGGTSTGGISTGGITGGGTTGETATAGNSGTGSGTGTGGNTTGGSAGNSGGGGSPALLMLLAMTLLMASKRRVG